MRAQTVRAGVTILWLASFLYCIAVALYYKRDIPSNFHSLLREIDDTFAQTLGAMLGFLFAGESSPKANSLTRSLSEKRGIRSALGWLALALSLAYILFFDVLMVGMATEKLRATEVVSLFSELRPYLGFLVTASIAYYFGQSSSKSHAAE